MNQVTTLGAMFDENGLIADLSEEQENEAAAAIGLAKEQIDLFAGDLINNRCRRLGFVLTNHAALNGCFDQGVNTLILALCKSMGYALSVGAEVATIARSWPRGDRVGGLTYLHYKAVQGCNGENGNLTREAARAILFEAQAGKRDKKGNYIQPLPPSWVKTKRQAKEGKPKAIIATAVDAQQHEVLSEIVPEVERAIKATGVTDRKTRTLTKKVESAIKDVFTNMQSDFNHAVDAKAAKEQKELLEETTKAAKEKQRYRDLREALVTPISKHEYKILLQFCHPDKHQGNEAKAGQALEIVRRIGEQLQMDKKVS